MSRHDSIDFGNRPPTGSAAPPCKGELAFASTFEKSPSSPIGSAPGASDSPASCPFHPLLDAPNPCRNRLTFTLSLSDHNFSQTVKIQTHRLNGSNLIKPNQTKKTFWPGPRPPSRPACRHRRSCLGVRRHVAALKLGDMSPSSKARTCPRTPHGPASHFRLASPATLPEKPSNSVTKICENPNKIPHRQPSSTLKTFWGGPPGTSPPSSSPLRPARKSRFTARVRMQISAFAPVPPFR
jgi:hypothetical protein